MTPLHKTMNDTRGRFISASLLILATLFVFIDWRVGLGLFLLAGVLRVIPLGIHALLSLATGTLLIGGLLYAIFNWKAGLVMIAFSLFIALIRAIKNKKKA